MMMRVTLILNTTLICHNVLCKVAPRTRDLNTLLFPNVAFDYNNLLSRRLNSTDDPEDQKAKQRIRDYVERATRHQ